MPQRNGDNRFIYLKTESIKYVDYSKLIYRFIGIAFKIWVILLIDKCFLKCICKGNSLTTAKAI